MALDWPVRGLRPSEKTRTPQDSIRAGRPCSPSSPSAAQPMAFVPMHSPSRQVKPGISGYAVLRSGAKQRLNAQMAGDILQALRFS